MQESEHRTGESVGDQSHRQFVCAKCDHVNPHTAAVCAQCGAHLFLKCKECGKVNERTSPRCTECGHRLRRSWWSRKVASKIAGPKRPVTPIQIVLLVVAILVAFKIILALSGTNMTPPAE